jgi:hypothetical protein
MISSTQYRLNDFTSARLELVTKIFSSLEMWLEPQLGSNPTWPIASLASPQHAHRIPRPIAYSFLKSYSWEIAAAKLKCARF